MVIYLKHPVHGTKVATMELEADNDEKDGWERFDPDEPIEELEVKRKYTLKLKKD